MQNKVQKYQAKMDLTLMRFEEILKNEINNSIINSNNNLNDNGLENWIFNLTQWLEIKIWFVLKTYFSTSWNRFKVKINEKVLWIFNNRKYNIVIYDTEENKIVCVIHIQKILYNINNNFQNLFKDTIVNTVSLEGKEIPLYTIFLIPSEWWTRNVNWTFWDKELFQEQNMYKLYNINNSKTKWFIKLITFNNEIKDIPLKTNIKIEKDISKLLYVRSNNPEKREEFVKDILIRKIEDIFYDIYDILTHKKRREELKNKKKKINEQETMIQNQINNNQRNWYNNNYYIN